MTSRAWSITPDTHWQPCSVCSSPSGLATRHDKGICMYDPRNPLSGLLVAELRKSGRPPGPASGPYDAMVRALDAHQPRLA